MKKRNLVVATLVVVMAIAGCASQKQVSEDSETASTYKDYWTEIRDQVNAVEETSDTECVISCYNTPYWDEPAADEPLSADTDYRFGLKVPDESLPNGLKVVVNVTYPEEVKSGDTGTIKIEAKDEHGNIWHGQYDFVAGEDLSFAHGETLLSANEMVGDGIFSVGEYNRGIVIELYSSAKTVDNYDQIISDNFAARTGACPTTLVYYHQVPVYPQDASKEPCRNDIGGWRAGGPNREDL